MSFRSLSLGAIALCLAVGVPFASASVECDAERGICRKTGAAVAAPAPAMVEEEVPAAAAAPAPAPAPAPATGCPKAAGQGHGQGKGAGHGNCAGCGKGAGHGQGGGCGKCAGHGQGAGHGQAAGAHQPPDRETIHGMLAQHEKIQRSVKDIDGGIVADTTSKDPEVAAMIKKHVAEMKTRLEQGQPTRMWDPLYAALYEHHDEIAMSIVEIEGGVRVTETSKNPEVVALIRQHATRGVSEFAAQGFERAHQPTPLPEKAGAATPAAVAPGAPASAPKP